MKNWLKIAPIGIFVFSFVIFLNTLAPDVMFTDSGELAAVCLEPGIAHPTGYPLFTILGHLWSKLPISSSPIWELNLMAAFFVSLAGVVFYFLALEVLSKEDTTIQDIILSVAGAFSYIFSLIVWAQATSVEVYSLHSLMISLVLFFAIKARNINSSKNFIIAGFLLGLSFANHLTTVLLLPALLFLFFKTKSSGFDFSKERFRLFLFVLVGTLIGLSIYLYLPIRSSMLPDFNWGWVHRSFDKFLYHVQGKQYQVWMFSDPELRNQNLLDFFKSIPYQVGIVGIIFVISSLANWKNYKDKIIFALILFISVVAYSINYSIHDIDPYFIGAVLALNVLMIIGLKKFLKKNLAYSALLIPAIAIFINYTKVDQSGNYLVPEFTRIAVEHLEEDALIISSQWDYWNSAFWYKQAFEGLRPDVRLIELELLRRTWYPNQLLTIYPELFIDSKDEVETYLKNLEIFESGGQYSSAVMQTSFVNMLNAIIDENIKERPVYVTLDILQNESEVGTKYPKEPVGFALKLVEDMEYTKFDPTSIKIDKFINSFKKEDNHLEEGIRTAASVNFINIGQYSIHNKDTATAIQAFEIAYKIDPENYNLQNLINNLK